MSSIYDWSVVAANNSNSDALITWAEGQAPSTVNNSARQLEARVREFVTDLGGSIAAAGTANGLTLTAASAFTTLVDGLIVSFRASASNTGAATLSVNGLAAKAIRRMAISGDVALAANDIRNTGIYVAQYSAALNGAAGAWLLINPTQNLDALMLQGTAIASATTTDIGAATGRYVHITGSVTITGFGTITAGVERELVFDAAPLLTYNATSLILPGAANIQAAAGDVAVMVSEGSGNWRCLQYTRGNGLLRAGSGAVATPGIGFLVDPTSGFYRSAANEIAVSLSGGTVGAWSANGFNTGLGTALINPNGATVGVSLSNVGAIVSYATAGINLQLGFNGNFTAANFVRAAASVGTIVCTPGATAYNTSSDKDLKTDWKLFDSGAILDRLEVWDFQWKESGERAYGVLAQDAYKVFPNAITPANEDVPTWSADYSKFVPLLLAEVKDLRRRLAAAGL